ncbi:hypothetical protein, partial [Streptomyces sp. NPDC005907]|uniref:hypothetical protein n=1 Tax=Streptomyces sp. NPDC005907 TaxID=3154571 RepID=UPI0033D36EA5
MYRPFDNVVAHHGRHKPRTTPGRHSPLRPAYQHVELEDGAILVTNLHPECVNPVVRYRLGD